MKKQIKEVLEAIKEISDADWPDDLYSELNRAKREIKIKNLKESYRESKIVRDIKFFKG